MIKISPHTGPALANATLQANLKNTVGKVLHVHQLAVSEVANWQELRCHAEQVKAHTLARLHFYLQELEKQIKGQGGKVVWADNAQDALDFVVELAHQREIRRLVKSKSMLSEEIGLNEALERERIETVETDLGEFIVQLAGEPPFHITAPALHKSRREIAQLFSQKLGMEPSEDVQQITATARTLLREHFLAARLGITGANFAVAETGTIVVVENEGNARLCLSVPETHVVLVGIEKVIPRMADLAVFLKLLTRSATGQRITSYVNLINAGRREREADGPHEFYVVLVDNGRSRLLVDPVMRQTLHCIRCGACLNVCPVYQKIGGHAYQSAYPGPIGAILTPQLTSIESAPEHPFASSLCGACAEVCPVRIPIPHILLRLRAQAQRAKNGKAARVPAEKWAFQLWAWSMSSPTRYSRMEALLRFLQKLFGRDQGLRLPFPPFSQWLRRRELPALAPQSFRQIYRNRKVML